MFARVALLGLLLIAPVEAAADSVVLSSTAPGLAVGRVLADGEALRLPDGSLTTLLRADGRVAKLHGPFEGPAATAFDESGAEAGSSLFAGWTGIEVSALGGARGTLLDAGSAPSAGGRVMVDPLRSGTWCIAPGAELHLTSGAIIEDPASGRRIGAQAGAPWPPDLPPADGATFLAHTGAGTQRLRFARAADLPPGPELAMRMAQAGCHEQAAPYLRRIGANLTPFALHLATDRGRTPRYALGEPIALVLQVNRPAKLACYVLKDDAVTALFPAPLDLADHQPLRIPGDRVAKEVAADPPPGLVEIRCHAALPNVAMPMPAAPLSEAVLERSFPLHPENGQAMARLFIRVE